MRDDLIVYFSALLNQTVPWDLPFVMMLGLRSLKLLWLTEIVQKAVFCRLNIMCIFIAEVSLTVDLIQVSVNGTVVVLAFDHLDKSRRGGHLNMCQLFCFMSLFFNGKTNFLYLL